MRGKKRERKIILQSTRVGPGGRDGILDVKKEKSPENQLPLKRI